MQYYEIDHFVFNKQGLIVIGDQKFREVLGDTIPIIPKVTLDDVLKNCVFLMLNEEGSPKISACFIPNQLIKDKNICAFYEMLYRQDRDEQIMMILHEIAHYVLAHVDEGLSDSAYYNQEKEANALRDKWIDDWEKHYKGMEQGDHKK